ncbi:MAG: phosphate acyltransferase PlsX [Nitrospina sp.]|nr:phosphate acyltransferase PlsX [Nitrospina sp.]
MKIVVDGMGGDHAPETAVEGAVLAAREYGISIILTGVEPRLKEELNKYPDAKDLPIEIRHAEEVVDMHDSPSKVVRSKRRSSMKIGLDLVKGGEASAFVSAGNTGAVLAYSTFSLRFLKGVDRPAIAIQLPTLKGTSILLDAGANVDCKANQLFQFALMGHVYAKYFLENENPSIGLLSIGEEDSKGNETTKEVFKMLKRTNLNFIGNLEGKEVYRGNADVIVCDGFIGNIALKISESLAEMIGTNLKEMFSSSLAGNLGYFFMKSKFTAFKKKVDYSEKGGAPLLGVNGVCMIAHGSSSGKAIKNAIARAKELIDKKINLHICEDIESHLDDKGSLWQQIVEMVSGQDDEEEKPGEKPNSEESPSQKTDDDEGTVTKK